MSGHRQAAVALHGLAPEDRQLILDELPEQDQATLRAYLSELDELGFEGGPAIVDMTGAEGADRLEHASVPALASALEHEPAALVGQLLAIRAWRWREELLGMMPAARRRLVCDIMTHGAPAPARGRFLLAALERRLVAAAPAPKQRFPLFSWLVQAWNR